MTAAIWSTKPNACNLLFPVHTLIKFMHNHHLLQLTSVPAWLTVRHGAAQYIASVLRNLKNVYLNTPVTHVRRATNPAGGQRVQEQGVHEQGVQGQNGGGQGGVVLTSKRGEERFDHVIFATHADTSLEILGTEATLQERDVLSRFEFTKNIATLHSDLKVSLPGVLPGISRPRLIVVDA
jgi:predicted NAD/FAD-binding protein